MGEDVSIVSNSDDKLEAIRSGKVQYDNKKVPASQNQLKMGKLSKEKFGANKIV